MATTQSPAETGSSPQGDVFLSQDFLGQIPPQVHENRFSRQLYDLTTLDIVRSDVAVATQTLNGERTFRYDACGVLISGLKEITDTIFRAREGVLEIEAKGLFRLGRGLYRLFEEYGVGENDDDDSFLRMPVERITDVRPGYGKGRVLNRDMIVYNPFLDLRIQFKDDLAPANVGVSPHLKHLFREDRPGEFHRIGLVGITRLSLLEPMESLRARTNPVK